MKSQKPLTEKEALAKLQRYCAYQERCHQEVRHKLLELGIRGDTLEEIIFELIQQGFLNEERFAKVFTGGKYRIKKWGRLKIQRSLQQKNISEYCIRKGLQEIEEEQYLKNMQEIINRKAPAIKADSIYEKRDKLSKFAINKGYEPDLVWQYLKQAYK